jgi:hypothetical protein
VYSFLLAEGAGEADLKLYVVPDESMKTAGASTRKFYSAAEVDELRQTAETAKKDAQAARDGAAKTIEERVNTFKASFPTQLTFPYRFKANERPFFVTAIYTDGTFHLHQVGRPGIARPVRSARWHAESHQLPGRTRRVRRRQNLGERVSLDWKQTLAFQRVGR